MKVKKRILVGHDREDWHTLYKRIVEDPVAKLWEKAREEQTPVPGFGVVCDRGCTTFTREGFLACWEKGHFDTPVYDYVEVDDGEGPKL